MVCLPAAGVGIATLHVEPLTRAGTGLAKVGSSTETLTDLLTLAENDGTSTHALPENPMKPESAFGPWMCTRRSRVWRSAPASDADGWKEKGMALSDSVGSTTALTVVEPTATP